MAPDQQSAEDPAVLELVLAAQERRHEVVDAVWDAKDDEEAAQRIRAILDVGGDMDPFVVLDMQISKLTQEARAKLAARVRFLREDPHGP